MFRFIRLIFGRGRPRDRGRYRPRRRRRDDEPPENREPINLPVTREALRKAGVQMIEISEPFRTEDVRVIISGVLRPPRA
jgi:hypothetical protein